ncbi:Protein root UVB sensitive 3, variant 2 [Trifolium repens]|nr:Protein root UVB sensitive 3, variant 2 [Trifolium repens]
MYANYRAVRCLALNSLNPERSSILLQHFTETGQVLSPKQVSSLEHVLPLQFTSWSSKKANSLDTKVRLGTRISSFDEIEIALFGLFHYTKAKLHSRSSMLHSRSLQIMFIKENLCIQTAKCGWKNSMKYLFRSLSELTLCLVQLKSLGWKTERLLSSPIIWRANWIHEPLAEKMNKPSI